MCRKVNWDRQRTTSIMRILTGITALALFMMAGSAIAQPDYDDTRTAQEGSLYEIPPRRLVDIPTAGTMPRGSFEIGFRLYPEGGALGFTDIGLSNRLTLGISYGGEGVLGFDDPSWNDRIEFDVKFRFVDEMEFFPAITAGFASQGYGAFNSDFDRYTYKSRGFYGVVSRSFYFYNWTSGWHAGINYSLENDGDHDEDINFFAGFDATFRYNLAFYAEYDAAINDNKSTLPDGSRNEFTGKGRGYLNISIKWLFTENLELEFILKDLLVNRRESDTITREIRIIYIDSF